MNHVSQGRFRTKQFILDGSIAPQHRLLIIISTIQYYTYLPLHHGNPQTTQEKVTSFFGFGGTVNIDVILDPTDRKKFWSIKDTNGKRVKLPIYVGEDDISGVVAVQLQDTKKFEHLGVKIELIGHLGYEDVM